MESNEQLIPSTLEAFRLINILEGIKNITTYDRTLNSTDLGRKTIRIDQRAIDQVRFTKLEVLTEIMTNLNTALCKHSDLSNSEMIELGKPLSPRATELVVHQLKRYLKPENIVEEEGHDIHDLVPEGEM
jgi:hypothetical protein